MFAKLIRNHILTNLAFGLVILAGTLSYLNMPREQEPSVNFNWIQVLTLWPGAAAADVERRVTTPLEDGIERIADVKFVNSSSREGISSILVRFEDLDSDQFNERIADLRREIQNQLRELPTEAHQPEIIEISSANAFPTATLAVSGVADNETLRKTAINTEKDIERLAGVDRVDATGSTDPEIQVHFLPQRLVGLGISPVDLADTVSAYYRDLAAGSIGLGDQQWFVRLEGTSSDPAYLESLPVLTAEGELPLRAVASVISGRDTPNELVRFRGRPAVLLSVFKEEHANNLTLIERIGEYIEERNRSLQSLGVSLVLLDDQTNSTREAIGIMERNALVGLLLVMLMVWLFLGFRVALLTAVGIAFVLAATFWVLAALGQTLNSTVLLAIVISLGMLVDDAVVVAESIYFKLRQGYEGAEAAFAGMREVAAPVTSAVLTTIAAFLPLMLMPGVLGNYMRFVPAVVTLTLVLSLIESFWMVPSHMVEARINLERPSRGQRLRLRATDWLRRVYGRILVRFLGHRIIGALAGVGILVGAITMVASGLIKVDYFATDLFRLFYINVEMPPGTTLQKSQRTLMAIEALVKNNLREGEVRSLISYSGQRFTENEPLFGDDKGQIFLSLHPQAPGLRTVDEMINDLRPLVESVPGPIKTSFLRRKLGPPAGKAISVKVRGDDIGRIRDAVAGLKTAMAAIPGIVDAADDDSKGRMELKVKLNPDAIVRAGLDPADIVRVVRLYADGEVVASMQHRGEKLEVRVRAEPRIRTDTRTFLNNTVGLRDGSEVTLGELLDAEIRRTTGNIRHYDFRRSITVEADIDTTTSDTVTANGAIAEYWRLNGGRFPGVDIKITGEFDDVQESLDAMVILFLVGLGLIYLILGAQFGSYRQPLMVIGAVPMAFTGVVIGLFVSGKPLSLYTLYGIVALAGISANDAIVLISTANRNLARGFSKGRAIVSAARRRVVPIIITSLTTIAGLFSLATGLAGESLMWGPVATAIVWGLGFSTVLTLFLVPLIYLGVVKKKPAQDELPPLPVLPDLDVPAWRRLLRRSGRKGTAQVLPDDAIADPTERELYKQGTDALVGKQVELAVRLFQKLADANPDSKLFNLSAVHSLLVFLQGIGWDVGYMARARRYLARAHALDPEDERLLILEARFKQIDAAKGELPGHQTGENSRGR